MIDTKKIYRDHTKDVHPVAAGVAGAAVGAALVGAAVVLNDKKNRDKVKKLFHKVKDTAEEYQKNMKDKVQETRENVLEVREKGEEKLAEETKTVKKAADSVKTSLERTAKAPHK